MYNFIRSSEEINSNGGFSFINKLLNGNNKGMVCRERLLPAAHNSRYSTSTIIRRLIGIQTAGECDYADTEKFRDDFLFRDLACGEAHSQESFRQHRGRLASRRDEYKDLGKFLTNGNTAMRKKNGQERHSSCFRVIRNGFYGKNTAESVKNGRQSFTSRIQESV